MGILRMGIMYLGFTALHFIQFILAIVVIGLYGVDINNPGDQNRYDSARWGYVIAVGAIAALTALLYMIPFVLRFAIVWIWDVIVFVLWIVAFGIFAAMYLDESANDSETRRMKNAIWVVLANALLWLIAAIFMGIYWLRHRERKSRFTGRADM